MMNQMVNKFCAIFALALLININIAIADFADDANRIFDWAERNYPQFFAPSGAATESLDPWLYRFYSGTNTYAGVNSSNEVWILGDVFGGMVNVSTVSDLLNLIEIGSSSGGNDCVNVPLPSSGLVTMYVSTGGSDAFSGEMKISYLEVSETQLRLKTSLTTTSDGVTTTDDIDSNDRYIIQDNILYLSEATEIWTTVTGGVAEPAIQIETRYEPALLDEPVLVFCEGQTWESNPVTVTKVVNGGDPVVQENPDYESGMVEAINESITAPAGIFNTVRVRTADDLGNTSISWISTEYGVFVRDEDYDSAGSLDLILELDAIDR